MVHQARPIQQTLLGIYAEGRRCDLFTRSGQNHTGIVTGYDSKSKTVFTIEGNTKDRVARRSYKLTDTYIVGYGKNGGVTEGQTDGSAESGKGYSTR